MSGKFQAEDFIPLKPMWNMLQISTETQYWDFRLVTPKFRGQKIRGMSPKGNLLEGFPLTNRKAVSKWLTTLIEEVKTWQTTP